MACCEPKKQAEQPPSTRDVEKATEATPLITPAESSKVPEGVNYKFIVFALVFLTALAAFASHNTDTIYMSLTGSLWLLSFGALLGSIDPYNHPAEDGISEDQRREAKESRISGTFSGPRRLERVACNQLENFPMALLVVWAAYNTGADKSQLSVVFAVYVALRICYFVCYLLALAPYRTIVFVLGQVTITVAMGYGFAAAGTAATKLIPMLCTSLLFLLQFVFFFVTTDPSNHPGEDAALMSEEAVAEHKKAHAAGPTRLDRVAVNQMEQFAMALIVMWAAAAVGADKDSLMYVFVTYFIFRIFFVACYLAALSPLRTIVFLGGQCSVVAAMVYGFLAAASDAQKVVPMACTATLWFLYFASLLGAVDDNNHPEEDLALGIDEQKRRAAFDKRAKGPTRMDRIAANQMESFPMALIVLWTAYILNAEKTYLAAMFITYTVLRIFYVVCYLFALSPLRTIVFLLGQLTIVVVIILGFLGTEKVHVGGGWHGDAKSGY